MTTHGATEVLDARTLRHYEALDVTPWLDYHLDILGEAIGLSRGVLGARPAAAASCS